jgi:3'-phosphoadenosine 5'-phosphosulfate sulfotransferase (PAPS reductase)/FAD synthetase
MILSEERIRQWYDHWDGEVYVSFSGGKDSTVLADMVARFCKKCGWKLYLLFVNTGLEYPELQKFVRTYAEWLRTTYSIDVQLDVVRPEMRFDEVIKNYGYPVVSKTVSNAISGAKNSISKGVYSYRLCQLGVQKDEYGGLHDDGKYDYEETLKKSIFRQDKWRFLLDADFDTSSYCCDVMKKKPVKQYEKQTGRKPIIGTMAWESQNRKAAWLQKGCNAFDGKRPTSTPMAFWTEQDILHYIKKYNVPYASVYGEIQVKQSENTEKGQINVIDYLGCYEPQDTLETTGCTRTGCIFCGFGCHLDRTPNRFQMLKETHPRQYEYCIGGGEMVDGKWQPSKEGLGLGHVLDYIGVEYE